MVMGLGKSFGFVALLGASLGVATSFAADWYAKDNLQPGHDPSMIRFEDCYALMSTNNNLQVDIGRCLHLA